MAANDSGDQCERDDLFTEVFRQSHDAIVVFDPGRDELVDVNPRACSLLGYDRDELLSRSMFDLHPDDGDAFESFVEQVFADGEGTTQSLSCRTRSGARIPTEIAASVVEYDGRDCVMAIIRDVTNRQRYTEQMEALNRVGQELMTAESRLGVAETITEVVEGLLDQPIAAVWMYDPEAERLEPSTATGRALDVVQGELPALGSDTFERQVFEAGETRVVDYADVSTPAAPGVPLRTTLFVPLGRHGLLSVGSTEPREFDEVTRHLIEVLAQTATAALEHVEREAALRDRTADLARQNQRLAEFASVVSHDLRNPLNVAQGFLELLDTEDTETVARIENALDRMEALIDDVLTLARQGEPVDDFEPVSLADLASACWRTTAHTDTELVVDATAERVLLADTDRFKRLLENLFRNAVEHGGAETIRVGVVDEDEPAESDGRGGFYVADDGTGIPESVRGQLFEPGVSTAEEGTGFGLRIVESIAEAHGWQVSVTDSADGGARFEVTGVQWADDAV